MAAKTSPPSVIVKLDTVPTFPFNGDKLDGDRTVAHFFAQSLYTGTNNRENKAQDAGDVVKRGLLAQRILAAGPEAEVTGAELELIEKCVCAALQPQFVTVIVMHLKQNVHPVPAAKKDDTSEETAAAQ